jgi:hypothetical protein
MSQVRQYNNKWQYNSRRQYNNKWQYNRWHTSRLSSPALKVYGGASRARKSR